MDNPKQPFYRGTIMNCRQLLSSALFLLLSLYLWSPSISAQTITVKNILVTTINSSINPATYNYLQEAFKKAEHESFEMVLIKINTPGGLVSTTKDILTLIGASNFPTIIWVTPEGASATSAGAIIASGAHFIFMSEGTNIGAATPIEMSGDIKEKDAKSKAINDLVALVQSLSESRGRNGQLFGEMVEKASSFKEHQALEKNLINGIANKEENILQQINNKNVTIKGVVHAIKTESAKFTDYNMDFGQKILDMFANPSMAYILFLIGAALIYLELQAPGGFIAGSIGAICLILAGIGFQILQLNIGALGLIILSFILFMLELYVTSYGLLAIAGMVSLIFGSLFLFRSDNTYLELSRTLIFSAVGSIGLFLSLITAFIIKDFLNIKSKSKNFFNLVGQKAIVIDNLDIVDDLFVYQIKVEGEIWKAQSRTKYNIGDHCEIKEHDKEKLTLII